MVDSHCASEGNKQLLIAAIRRFYRYTLRNLFLAQTYDMHVSTIASSCVARTNTKAFQTQSRNDFRTGGRTFAKSLQKCIGEIRKIASCRFYSCFASTILMRFRLTYITGVTKVIGKVAAFIYNLCIF